MIITAKESDEIPCGKTKAPRVATSEGFLARYGEVEHINIIYNVKKKHLTHTAKYGMIPKVITNGKVCRTYFAL